MTARTRSALLFFLAIVFVVLGTILVLYSGGARFDLRTGKIVQTGGIYLKTEPEDVSIKIDGKQVKNDSGFLQSGTFFSNLAPGTYKALIEKEGYYSWQKEIRVASSSVAVFDGVILFPRERQLAASPTDKFLSELQGKPISRAELAELTFLFNQLKEGQLSLPGAVSIKKVLPYPYNNRKFVVMTDRALYTLDAEKRVLAQVAPRAGDFTFTGNELFWFDEKGLYSFNLILRNQSQITLPPELKPSLFAKIELSSSAQAVAILKKDNEIVLFERPTNKVVGLGNSTLNFLFSPDDKKIAISRPDGSLSVYGIKAGAQEEKYILENFTHSWAGVEGILWHEDNNYLFLEDKIGKLYFVEVSEDPPTNVVEIASEVKNFTYNEDDHSLYWQDPRGIWQVKL